MATVAAPRLSINSFSCVVEYTCALRSPRSSRKLLARQPCPPFTPDLHPRFRGKRRVVSVRASTVGPESTSSGESGSSSSLSPGGAAGTEAQPPNGSFCIIEGPDTIQDFARMQLGEIQDNINSRRNRIFLLMEEIRRLRIQQRLKKNEKALSSSSPSSASLSSTAIGPLGVEEEEAVPLEYPSSIPFFPPLTSSTLQQYYATFASLIGAIIVFGGLVAPILEVKLGLGGTSYADFIASLRLPSQLSQVDPIVASFSGGAVGVLSSLMIVEANNVEQQEHKRCKYCTGTGYLACARCSGTGALVVLPQQEEAEGRSTLSGAYAGSSPSRRCPNCAGSAKVMCPTCLCTGMALATEHDPRIDPFD